MNIISALLYNTMMEMDIKTEVSKFDSKSDGHIIIAPLSEKTRKAIYAIQNKISDTLPVGSLWLPSGRQLHITFVHLISPDSTYDESKKSLWQNLESEAKESLKKIADHNPQIHIKLQQIEAFPSTIILKWEDDGSFGKLRTEFTQLVHLPEKTRRPPNIIHTTIARFKKEISFDEVKKIVKKLELQPINDSVTSLDLIHEEKIFVQQHRVIENYPLRLNPLH